MSYSTAPALPYDGEIRYIPDFLSGSELIEMFNGLKAEIDWEADRFVMFGREVTAKRMVAWFGDRPYEYIYSHSPKIAKPWPPVLAAIKSRIKERSSLQFNSCLTNYYPSSDVGMGWHRDNEDSLVPGAAIASVSLGSARKFAFKHRKTKAQISLILEPGSLLLMLGTIQTHWYHCLRKSSPDSGERINLTFRSMKETSAAQ